jgi:hypothetical protein
VVLDDAAGALEPGAVDSSWDGAAFLDMGLGTMPVITPTASRQVRITAVAATTINGLVLLFAVFVVFMLVSDMLCLLVLSILSRSLPRGSGAALLRTATPRYTLSHIRAVAARRHNSHEWNI